MYYRSLLLGSLALSAAFLYTVHTTFADIFTRNLSVGMSGTDVRALQVFLNSDPRTRIASSGIGSPGKETNYFGSLTAFAVAKYQELNAPLILTPAGLSRGNGFVGTNTRRLIESAQVSKTTPSTVSTSGTVTPFFPSTPITSTLPIQNPQDVNTMSFGSGMATLKQPLMAYFSAYEISPGDTLTISGGGFLNENTITFDTKYGTPFSLNGYSKNGTTIILPIPNDAAIGKYTVSMSNTNGKAKYSKRLAIKNRSMPSPTVTSITPTSGTFGTEVTVTGTGFTAEDNEILGAISIMDLPSSDGKTLHFKVEPIPEMFAPTTTAFDWKKTFTWKMRFGVINANGISSSAHPVEFQFTAQ